MDNNKILKIAYLQAKCEPNNVVKVAGVLAQLKRWLSGLFDEGQRKQIDVIDKKYEAIKYLLAQLQDNINSIESSIESVNLVSYDANVNKLVNTIEVLEKRLRNAKHDILDADSTDVIESKTNTISNKDILSLFQAKSLSALGIRNDQIKYSQYGQFYNSLLGQNYGSGNVAKFFGDNQEKYQKFVEQVKGKQIAQDLPNILLDFKIVKVLEPKTRERKSNLFEVAQLITRGLIPINFDNKKIGIVVQINLDVFMHSIDDVKEELSNAVFAVSKQYVHGLVVIDGKRKEQTDVKIVPTEDKSKDDVFDKDTTKALDRARQAV